jgi:tetratricopeptide (TPR) repeat protein
MLANKEPVDIAGATDAYTKSAELAYDKSPWHLNDISMFLYRNTDQYDQAIRYCEQALKIMNFGAARKNLGLAEYYKWGDSMQNPQKYKNAKVKPLEPNAITLKTGVTPQMAFISSASIPTRPYTAIHLLKKGIIKDENIDLVPDDYEGTALYFASNYDNLDLIKLLVKKGANVNTEYKKTKQTPLSAAVSDKNFEMVKFLVEHGARVNASSIYGAPIHFSLNQTKGKPASILEYLLVHGADPTIPYSNGEVLIALAVKVQDIDAVRLLVEKYHADVNAKTSGMPILASAAVQDGAKGKEIVKILLKAGANPWVKYGGDVMYTLTRDGIDPVMFPSFKENADMILKARKSYPKPSNFDPDKIE